MVMSPDAEISTKARSAPFEVWERTGITEHMGGVKATASLIGLMEVAPGLLVLDIGCGTGYTACLLAKRCGVRVIGMDASTGLLARARKRAEKEGVSDKVSFIHGDANRLPFKDGVFDRGLAESVLVFCDKGLVSRGVYRTLKSNGLFGDNELTLLKPSPPELDELLMSPGSGLGLRPVLESEWHRVFEEAGFDTIASSIHPINYWTQIIDHLNVYGLKNYLAGAIRGLKSSSLRKSFINKKTSRAGLKFLSYVGYGLYVYKKSGKGVCVKV